MGLGVAELRDKVLGMSLHYYINLALGEARQDEHVQLTAIMVLSSGPLVGTESPRTQRILVCVKRMRIGPLLIQNPRQICFI